MGRVRWWTASLQECLPCLTVGLNQSINRNIGTALKGFDGSNRVRFPGRLRNFSINAFRDPAEELVVFAPPFPKALHGFHIRWKIARVFSHRPTESLITAEECPESVAEIPALFLARP